MDIGTLGAISLDWRFAAGLASIVFIDLVLAGDNAIVIAMAVRSLPRDRRLRGMALGAGAAVLVRVVATFFVARLLLVPYVKLAGGALILWVAVRLFLAGAPEKVRLRESAGVGQAVRLIVVADITMALDNLLAVGGASHGNLLLLFGLAFSIPFVVLTSSLLALLMDRYPAIVYAGAAMLGKVAAEMILTDRFTDSLLELNRQALWAAEGVAACGVILAGRLLLRLRAARVARGATASNANPPGGEGS